MVDQPSLSGKKSFPTLSTNNNNNNNMSTAESSNSLASRLRNESIRSSATFQTSNTGGEHSVYDSAHEGGSQTTFNRSKSELGFKDAQTSLEDLHGHGEGDTTITESTSTTTKGLNENERKQELINNDTPSTFLSPITTSSLPLTEVVPLTISTNPMITNDNNNQVSPSSTATTTKAHSSSSSVAGSGKEMASNGGGGGGRGGEGNGKDDVSIQVEDPDMAHLTEFQRKIVEEQM